MGESGCGERAALQLHENLPLFFLYPKPVNWNYLPTGTLPHPFVHNCLEDILQQVPKKGCIEEETPSPAARLLSHAKIHFFKCDLNQCCGAGAALFLAGTRGRVKSRA